MLEKVKTFCKDHRKEITTVVVIGGIILIRLYFSNKNVRTELPHILHTAIIEQDGKKYMLVNGVLFKEHVV